MRQGRFEVLLGHGRLRLGQPQMQVVDYGQVQPRFAWKAEEQILQQRCRAEAGIHPLRQIADEDSRAGPFRREPLEQPEVFGKETKARRRCGDEKGGCEARRRVHAAPQQ